VTSFEGVSHYYDAVVVGARPAGAATAMLLARRGLQVLAVDRGGYGTDTLSTHALMRAGVLQLARWGLLDRIEAEGTPRVCRVVFHYEDDLLDLPIKPKDGVSALFAPRRTVLDRVLADAAVSSGASVRHGVRVDGLLRGSTGRIEGVRLSDQEGETRSVRAEIVIGADGLRGNFAALAGAPITRRGGHAAAVVYGYWSGLDMDGYHWYWRPGLAAGAIPTNEGLVLLFAAVSSRRFAEEFRPDVAVGYRRVLERVAPDLVPRLSGARLVSPLRGSAGEVGYLRRPWGPGWALVGDAGYYKDPLTAHGISDALRDAELLARAIARGDETALRAYEAARDELSHDFFATTDAIASFEWDDARLKDLHQDLSDAMKREVSALRTLHEGGNGTVRLTA
jgi:menaquinone-9 beta-reductase